MALCVMTLTLCPIGSKMVGLGGYFHLLQAPFGTAVAKKHCPCAPSWPGVAASAAQVPNWLLPSKKWRRCQCDASMMTGSHPSWSNLLHLRFYSGNNLRVRWNVPMFYMDLWPACAHPKIPLHLCYQNNSNCPTAMRCALDLVEYEQGGEDSHSYFPQPCAK